MSLESVLNEIKSHEVFANENVEEEGAIETLVARRGRKRNAQEQIANLRELYIKELMGSVVFILATGLGNEEFSHMAKDKFGCFVYDPEALYLELANRIPDGLIGRETSAGLFDVLGRHLEDVANDMQIIGYPQLIYRAQYATTINNREDLLGLVKLAINDQVGSEMVGIYAVRNIADLAMAMGHTSPVTPVILNTSDEKLVAELSSSLKRLTSKVFVVTAGKATRATKATANVSVKEVSEESVQEALTNIRGSLKK